MRSGSSERTTRETVVRATITLNISGNREIATGQVMLDHLLDQFAFHAGCAVEVTARSLDSIAHHVVEDVALTLGCALSKALDDRCGIARFGSATIAMDDALARAAVDLGGRPYARTDFGLTAQRVEDLDTVMLPHFFRSFASSAGLTVHIDVLHGFDPHHCIEASFKAFAQACCMAWSPGLAMSGALPSTKGLL